MNCRESALPARNTDHLLTEPSARPHATNRPPPDREAVSTPSLVTASLVSGFMVLAGAIFGFGPLRALAMRCGEPRRAAQRQLRMAAYTKESGWPR